MPARPIELTVRAPGTPRRADLLWIVGAALLLVAWDLSGLDLQLIRLYGDAHGFALRENVVVRTVLHDGGRWLAAFLLVLLAWDACRPLLSGPTRKARAYWLLVVTVSLLAVPLLKRFSATSCPWDLAEFGGRAAYVSHWLFGVADGGNGHCFPAGHALAGFAFFGTYFLWREHRPRVARAVLVAVLLLGTAYGWAQMARGAHFASHNLWSAWLCWTIAVFANVAQGVRTRAAATAPPSLAPRGG